MKKWFQRRVRQLESPAKEATQRVAHAAKPNAAALQDLANRRRTESKLDEARLLYQQAIDLDPAYWPAWLGRGLVDLDMGQPMRAKQAFEHVDQLRPDSVDAPYFLGLIALDHGQRAIAAEHFLRALKVDPGFKPALRSLAPLGRGDEEFDRFEKLARAACALHPEDLDLRALYGIALRTVRQREQALVQFDHVLQFRPDLLEILINRAEVLGELGRLDEAKAAAQALLAIGSMRLEVRIALGWVFVHLGMPERARAEYEAAQTLGPPSGDLYHLLGKIEWIKGNLSAARAAWQQASALEPEHAAARMGLADCFFFEDDYANGWPAYEARLELGRLDLSATGQEGQSLHNTNRWNGRPDPNSTLYIWAEQGFGDQIMMAPWIVKAQERFQGRVVLHNPKPLQRLFEQIVPLDRQIDARDQIPQGALNCPELSLPLAMGELHIPVPRAAYLKVPVQWQAKFSNRASVLTGLKVGLVWAGAARYTEDHQRSIELTTLAPLGAVPGISWISLQKGSDPTLMQHFPAQISDWTEDITDFADTAGLMSQLDLVIAVDTGPAHLAGALGIPVWLLSRYPGEWRWGSALDGKNHWYQSMKVFTQPSRGDWVTVIERVRLELCRLVEQL